MVGANGSGGAAPPPRSEVFIPPWWLEAAEAVASAASPPPVAVVCGPKNSGKSTFSRFLLNTLLQRHERVGYLDTDVGQPEFSPPGCLSLHIIDESIPDLMNPSLRAPERCFFYGDISSKRDPEAYTNCVFNLYDYFTKYYRREEPKSTGKSMLPLIVNTPGWVKGTGYDLLVEMLRYICPNAVVQLRISVETKNLPMGTFWSDSEQTEPLLLIDVSSSHHDALNRSVLIQKDARGLRDHRLLQYFKQCFPTDASITTNKKLAHALASLPPYEVPFSKVTSSEVWHSMNATIVGLAVSSDKTARIQSLPWCIGLGIVRGIDVRRGLLYIITPVPCRCLQNVDLLLHGFIELPTSLLQVGGCVSPYMSTNVLHRIADKDL